jgi:2,5-diketo-D-gluconate reductase A
MTAVPNLTLIDGPEIPQLGFGVFQIPDAETEAAVTTALQAGYRSIDTAAIYRNEVGVGKALAESGIARDELYVTTKLWNEEQGYDSTLAACEASLEKLGLDYVDLYLIHWPAAQQGRYLDTWRAFEKLLADGRTKAIGVSNFQPPHLERVLEEGSVVPAVNQIELHPLLQQAELREFHRKHGILTEAWSPLAQGELLEDRTLVQIAARHGKTVAQVVLRWHVQLGNVVIPKSVTPSRIAENIDVFDFELTFDDLAAIEGLEAGHRTGPDPDTFYKK